MSTIIDDLRFSLRLLVRNPGFALISVVALAVGIGANTAIFSVVNGVLLQPLPYSEPARLVMVYESTQQFQHGAVAYLNFLDWRRENRSFADIAAFRNNDFNFTGSGEPVRLSGEYVSAGLFRTLGVEPLLGRRFLPEEDRRGAGGVVMLGYGLWKERFQADRAILGKSLTLNGRDYTVIGVLPANFRFLDEADLYVPLGQWNAVELTQRTSRPGLRVVARLNPGVSLAAAQSEMTSIASELAREYPRANADHGATVVPMHDDMVGAIRPTLLLLLGAVGFVLIVACANVANLLLARSISRRRELAVRAALGAGRGRVVRQLLTESIMLGVSAGALGLLLAFWGTQLLLAAIPDRLPHTQHVAMDGYVLLFTLGVSVLTGILFGLAPAFHGSKLSPHESLKEGARTSSRGRRRTEHAFVAVQIGLAVVLLAGAALMIQSLWRLWQVDPGFDASHVLTAQIALSPTVAGDPARIRTAYRDTLTRVRGIRGVQSAAIAGLVPMSGDFNTVRFETDVEAQSAPPNRQASALWFLTTPDYLQVFGIPLLRGRFFTDRDTTASAPVVVIDDVLARHLFPNRNPIGREIKMQFGPYSKMQIVGVVGHVKHYGLDADDTAKVRDELYFPIAQIPDQFMVQAIAGAYLLMRTATDPSSVVPALHAAVAGPTADQPVYRVRTMEQIIATSLAERHFIMLVLAAFSCTALVLAAIGVYGVMSYAVSRRTQELGVRAALGATRSDVLKLVMRDGMALATAGMAAGLLAALGTTRLLASMLYSVRPADPVTLLAVSLTLLGVAFVASYLPARRATKIDPMAALRHE
jgi:predicted permease